MRFVLTVFVFLSLSGLKAQPVDSVYTQVEIMPEYPGGDAAFLKHFKDSITYPSLSLIDDVPSGKIVVRFVVNEDGTSSDFRVIHGMSPEFDEHIIRVLKTLCKFKPGMQKGKPVKVYYTLPVHIHLK